MTLPATGPISAYDINLEFGQPGTTAFLLTSARARGYAGVASGTISFSNFRSKSNFSAVGVNAPYSFFYSNTAGGSAAVFPSVNLSGGTAPFTYAWTMTSSVGGPTLTDANLKTCQVAHTYARSGSGTFTAFLQCVITDAVGSQATVTGIRADAQWGPTPP